VDGGRLELEELRLSLAVSSSMVLSSSRMRAITDGGSPRRSCSGTSTSLGSSVLSIGKEQFTEITTQGVEEDGLDRLACAVGAVFAPTAGEAGMNPVCRLVTGAGETRGVDEGLQQHQGLVVKGLPVVGKAAGVGRKDPGSQTLDLDPWQDEETNVAGYLMEVGKPLLVVPADEAIAGGNPPGGGTPSQGGNQAAVKIDEVFEVGADDFGVAQIVVGIDKMIPEGFIGAAADHGEAKLAATVCAAVDSGGVVREGAETGGFLAGPANMELAVFKARWQDNRPFALQGKEQNAGGAFLDRTVGLPPVPVFTKQTGYGGAALAPVGGHEAADGVEIAGGNLPAADAIRLLLHAVAPS